MQDEMLRESTEGNMEGKHGALHKSMTEMWERSTRSSVRAQERTVVNQAALCKVQRVGM